ncbi:MAG TPA: MFS transporter [Roseiflexaceae bacterium]|nr:MFS transporter [Roseiflexaceae bacterium]
MATTTRARYPALRYRNFTLIWSGLLVSNMGTWMQNVAQSWLIYKLTGNNPLYLGWLGLAFAVPMVLVPPLGGALADRVDRVKLLYVTQTGSLLLAALLAMLAWSGAVQPWHILLTTFGGALLLAFDNPTRQALIPELVPREDLLNALSLNSATYTGAALIGPALAGVLLDVVGAGWLFMLNALSFLAVIWALRSMRDLPIRPRRPVPLREALFGGFIYAWKQRLILFLLLLSALAALFGRSYQQLLPIFADDIWRVGPSGYGTLLAAGGAGALIGAFAMASIKAIERQGRVLVISGLIFCAALAVFVLCPWFWPGVMLLAIVGIAATVFSTMIATVIQLRVPGELRGRVMSLYAITLIGLPSLGALGVAALANTLGAEGPSAWSRVLLVLLDALGVNALTSQLGAAAGAPRAIIVGALALTLVLVVTAPLFVREGAASTAP